MPLSPGMPANGSEPVHPPALPEVGGTQFPFTHTQSEAGLVVVQLLVLPLVLPAGARLGGTQSPLTQTQSEAGFTVVQVDEDGAGELVPPLEDVPPDGTRLGGSQSPL